MAASAAATGSQNIGAWRSSTQLHCTDWPLTALQASFPVWSTMATVGDDPAPKNSRPQMLNPLSIKFPMPASNLLATAFTAFSHSYETPRTLAVSAQGCSEPQSDRCQVFFGDLYNPALAINSLHSAPNCGACPAEAASLALLGETSRFVVEPNSAVPIKIQCATDEIDIMCKSTYTITLSLTCAVNPSRNAGDADYGCDAPTPYCDLDPSRLTATRCVVRSWGGQACEEVFGGLTGLGKERGLL